MIGLPAVLANLARIGAAITIAEAEGREAGAEVIREAWVGNIEAEGLVDTGNYRDSVHVEREGGEVAVVTDVDYARFLEFGTSNIEAHPVAERAVEESGEKAIGIVGDHVGAVIR